MAGRATAEVLLGTRRRRRFGRMNGIVWETVQTSVRTARRAAVLLIGATVVLFGAALIFLPGPAILVIPLGLAILATEFAWARRWLRILKQRSQNELNRWTG